LQRAGGKGAPERIDQPGFQEVRTLSQPLGKVMRLPVGGAACLRAQLAGLGYDSPRLDGANDRMAPG